MEQISQVPGPVGVGRDMDTQPNHKKNIKLWIGVIVGVVAVALGATFLFKGTTIFKGQTPPALPVECSLLTTERTCKTQSDCGWDKMRGVCTSNVAATEEVTTDDKADAPVDEQITDADTTAGEKPGDEAGAIAREVAIFPGATDEEKPGDEAVADETTANTDTATVEEKTGEEASAADTVEVALAGDDEFETACNNLGPDGIWNGSVSTCTYKGITFESLAEFTAATQPDDDEDGTTGGEKTDKEDTSGGDKTDGKDTLGGDGIVDEKTCVADPVNQWNAEAKTCEKITAEDLPDQTSQQIQDLQNQIAQLQRELAATQSNSANYSALIQQISALQQQIANRGGEQPTIVVNVPSTSGGGSSNPPARSVAPTECADPDFTFDAARGVCVPPTEVVVNVDTSSDEDNNGGVNRNRRGGSGEYDPGFEVTSASAEDNAAVTDDSDNQDESSGTAATVTTAAATGAETGAGAVERTTYGTYIQGDTGPELLLYPVLIGAANGLFYLGRRKKRGQ